MFDAAVAAKVPLNKRAARRAGWDCYAQASSLQAAYDAFLASNGGAERVLKDCLLDYLAWRYQVRSAYAKLASTQRADADDREDLAGANATLLADIGTVEAAATIDARIASARQRRAPQQEIESLVREQRMLKGKMAGLSDHAAEIVSKLQGFRAITAAEAELFGNYCHDSYAGFKPFDAPVALGVDAPGTWEPEGYLRYRTRYSGDDARLTQRLRDGSQRVVELA